MVLFVFFGIKLLLLHTTNIKWQKTYTKNKTKKKIYNILNCPYPCYTAKSSRKTRSHKRTTNNKNTSKPLMMMVIKLWPFVCRQCLSNTDKPAVAFFLLTLNSHISLSLICIFTSISFITKCMFASLMTKYIEKNISIGMTKKLSDTNVSQKYS